jgi:hypothetical protein
MYEITKYSKDQAKRLNVEIQPSSVKNKKISVLRNGKKIADIGHTAYKDYPTYIKEKGKKYADERRRLYKLRHQCTNSKKDTPQYYACNILW